MSLASNTTLQLELSEQFLSTFDILENTEKNVFVTGKAGTGKSTLLKYFRDNTAKNTVVLAPTGMAAVNVKGQTIHSFFQFKPDITPESIDFIKMRKSKKQLYENIDVIVIDEVSMVRSDMMDCIDAFLKIHGKVKGAPFGGVQMVFFGDLFQLPPVVTRQDRDIFNGVYRSPYFFDAKSFTTLSLEVVELEKIYRQTEQQFIELLSRIRNRTPTSEDLNVLNKRCISDFSAAEDEMFLYLTTTNEMASRVNEMELTKLKTRPYRFEGDVVGDFDFKNLPTGQRLDLKYNAQVMLLNNDPTGRWINGSVGRVISVNTESECVVVELSNGERVDVEQFTWEVYKFSYNEEERMLESDMVGSFTQFPLKLAWAVTIHKSQGQTFSRVVIDFGRGTFSHGQAYVALSRCTSLEGLVLKRPFVRQNILLDQRVVEFMNKAKVNQADEVLYEAVEL